MDSVRIRQNGKIINHGQEKKHDLIMWTYSLWPIEGKLAVLEVSEDAEMRYQNYMEWWGKVG